MRSVQACAAAVASLLVFCGLAQAGEEKQGGDEHGDAHGGDLRRPA